MKKLVVLPLCLGAVFVACTSRAIDLKQSKVTQVVNDVQIISAADQKEKSAAINDIFSMPDILRTGAAARAELVAPDETVTRVGANTIFSFDPANRTIDLKQGSLLFHAPHGKGGGTIHTGSATASVLGTTLIVVTTANGGFKVIDLEGEVEVKFLNGLKQKLDAGQMTFILPGANQLAPVIIFRLDELTLNSLLVKGFGRPLESLPLIQNQIEKQLKQIQTGKASDTGLYAGDDASPNQVEVLDLNTLPHSQQKPPPPQASPLPPPPPQLSPLAAAEAADAIIFQPSLTDASIPTPPLHVFTGTPFSVTGDSFFNGQTFSGFVARNIIISTPTVNLSPYASQRQFDFVAVNGLSLAASGTFSGLSSEANLSLIAGGQMSFASGISLTTEVNNFLFSSPQSLTLNAVHLFNYTGNLLLNSGDAIAIQPGCVITAGGNLAVNAANNISVVGAPSPFAKTSAGSPFTAGNAQFSSANGSIRFTTAGLYAAGEADFTARNAITFNSCILNANSMVMNGTGNTTISLNNTPINLISAPGTPGSLSISAPGGLSIVGGALGSDPVGGAISLASSAGSVNVFGTPVTAQTLTVTAGTDINFDEGQAIGGGGGEFVMPGKNAAASAHYLKLNSGDGILLSPAGKILTPSESSSIATFAAANVINVNNSDLTSYATVNMAANTINLSSVAFGYGSSVTLRSLNGVLAPNPNTGAASLPGDVNFIQGVTYGGSPAQYYVGNGITVTTLH